MLSQNAETTPVGPSLLLWLRRDILSTSSFESRLTRRNESVRCGTECTKCLNSVRIGPPPPIK